MKTHGAMQSAAGMGMPCLSDATRTPTSVVGVNVAAAFGQFWAKRVFKNIKITKQTHLCENGVYCNRL
jgi:hypothetical protein